MKLEESKLIGRLMAAEFVIDLLLDATPAARQALARIDLDKLEGSLLGQPLADTTAAGFVEAMSTLQKRHSAHG